MGACASRPSREERGKDSALEGVALSQRYMLPSADYGKRTTADVISSALLAQAEADTNRPDSSLGISARLASRLGVEDGRASSRAALLTTRNAPSLESAANLPDRSPHVNVGKGADPRSMQATADPPQGSFDPSRAEAVKPHGMIHKSFRDSVSPAWAFVARKTSRDAADDIGPHAGGGGGGGGGHRSSSAYEDRRSCDAAGSRMPEGRCKDGRGPARGGDGDGGTPDDLWFRGGSEKLGAAAAEEEEEVVVPLGGDIGGLPTALVTGAGAGAEVAGYLGWENGAAVAGGRDGSHGPESSQQRCDAPRAREGDAPGSSFRTVSISRVQGLAKVAAAAADCGGAAAASVRPTAAATTSNTEGEAETDELTSLPLPNMVTVPRGVKGGGGIGGGGGGNLRQRHAGAAPPPPVPGHRCSASAYLPQAPLEYRMSGAPAVATRNSDLGYYLEEARFTSVTSASLLGTRPVRHNLMDSPAGRPRMARDDGEAIRPPPVVLDYVPAIKSQPSRGNLLQKAQPSQKQRLLAGGYGGELVDDDEGGDGNGSAPASASRRLEYVPNKSFTRKSSHAAMFPSGSLLLAGAASPRPMSPLTGRRSLASPQAPSSPRTINGGVESERCFHVTRAGVAAAASPLAATQRRGDGERRVSSSASQVHCGFIPLQQLPSSLSLLQQQQPPLSAVHSTPSQELARRVPRAAVVPSPDARTIEPSQLPSSPIPSRLQIQSSGAASAAARQSAVHDVLCSTAWAGPSVSALVPATVSPAAAASLSASGALPRAAFSSYEPRGVDVDAAAVIAASGIGGVGSYSLGSGSRTAGRAARLLATVQRMAPATPEVAAVQ